MRALDPSLLDISPQLLAVYQSLKVFLKDTHNKNMKHASKILNPHTTMAPNPGDEPDASLSPAYRVSKSICMKDFKKAADPGINWMVFPLIEWPWAENAEDFYCVFTDDSNGGEEKPCYRVWSQIMIDNYKLLREQPDQPDRRLPVCKPKSLRPFPLLRERRADGDDAKHEGAARPQVRSIEVAVKWKDDWPLKQIFKDPSVVEAIKEEDWKTSGNADGVVLRRSEYSASESRDTVTTARTEKKNVKELSKQDKARERRRNKQLRKRLNRKYRENDWKRYLILPGKSWIVHGKASKYVPKESYSRRWPVWIELPDDTENRYVRVKFVPGNNETHMPADFIDRHLDNVAIQSIRPKLEEFFPVNTLPDELELINLTETGNGIEAFTAVKPPLIFRGRWPPLSEASRVKPKRTTLRLAEDFMGSGHRAQVKRGIMRLPDSLETTTGETEVSLAVKIANDSTAAFKHLENEGSIYNQLSTSRRRFVQSDWSGHIVCDSGPYGFADR